MAGELEKYLQQYQEYVKLGEKVGIRNLRPEDKPVPPPVELDEEEAIKEVEELIKHNKIELIPQFDQSAFHAKVLDSVTRIYTVSNPCTIAYRATDLGIVTPCESFDQAVDYWGYLVSLYEIGFVHIWGYGYQDAFDKVTEPGCPNCTGEFSKCGGWWSIDAKALYMGDPFYVILRQLRRVIRKSAELDVLVESGISWTTVKRKLRRPSLYSVGSLAYALLRKK